MRSRCRASSSTWSLDQGIAQNCSERVPRRCRVSSLSNQPFSREGKGGTGVPSMRSSGVTAACLAVLLVAIPAAAQDSGGAQAPTPAPPAGELPPVDVIQKNATPAPTAQKKVTPKKK